MEQIASIVAMKARRRARAIARTGGKPWTVRMTRKDGQECSVRCEEGGAPVAFKTISEAYRFRDWMVSQFGEWCRYEISRV